MPVPGQFFARASSRHRVACKALYRAILQSSSKIPLPNDVSQHSSINPLTHLIRKRFRQNAFVDSPHMIRNALQSGYLSEHVLRLAADGVSTAIEQIHRLVHSHQADVESSRRACSQPELKPRLRPRVWPYSSASKLVEKRPLPLSCILSGQRHVPSLVMTSAGIPFLRFKRPQSPYLSRVIRDKVVQKQKKIDLRSQLEITDFIAKSENDWEDTVLQQIERNVEGGIQRGGSKEWWWEGWGNGIGIDKGWDSSITEAQKEIDAAIRTERASAKAYSEKMTKIYLEEKRLWQEEKEVKSAKRSANLKLRVKYDAKSSTARN
ncbi:unnamed protein product [Blumeria hordei]|uniref:Complex 1 LYR protein domain-containing protein n=1 Tax=Blumeria hordei TaxID=2867405 RepID=A0A383UIW0_BLUHO|nr:unnamed protein product [Blumeria hordei]